MNHILLYLQKNLSLVFKQKQECHLLAGLKINLNCLIESKAQAHTRTSERKVAHAHVQTR